MSIFLCGCVTGFQPYTWSGGYKDEKLSEGHYLVEYYGNGSTSAELVKAYWTQRASELCPIGYDIVEEEKGSDNSLPLLPGYTIAYPWYKAEIRCK